MPSDSQQATPARVARIITRLNIGGPSIQAARLTTALEPFGFTTRLLHGRLGIGEGDMTYLLPAGANTAFIDTLCRPLSPIDDLRAIVRVYRELRQWQPHIVHTHMAKAGLVGRLATVGYNLTRGSAPRARVVHTYHGHVLEGYFNPLMTRVFITIERLLARVSHRIVAISPAIRRELLDVYRIGRAEQYRVVALGFDLAPFAAIDDRARAEARRVLDIPGGAVVVATVGRLTAIKQHRRFLEAFRVAAGAHPEALALIAGDGERRVELETQARSLGIADRVRFLGWRRDLPTIYGATDVFLLTSRNEGTPVALIEAMASGVPGVSTDVGGVQDVIGTPATGILAPSGDVAALAAGVSRLLADRDEREAMGARARQRVLARYGIERLVAEIAALYRDVLDAR